MLSKESESESSEKMVYTIDGLLRNRAAGEKADEPIVAYPAEGTEYAYYTPRQVGFLQLDEGVCRDGLEWLTDRISYIRLSRQRLCTIQR